MRYSLENEKELWSNLKNKLKNSLKDIVFIELNKDVILEGNIEVEKDIVLPLKSEYLIEGIKNNEYADSIKLDKVVRSMMYILGCDDEFKYNDKYIELIRKIKGIDSYILKLALEFADQGKLTDSLIYFIALEKISDKHKVIKYNIALILKELWSIKNENKSEDRELYYKLALTEFLKLSAYKDMYLASYHLGFLYLEKDDKEKALFHWKYVLDNADDDSLKDEVSKLVENLIDTMEFEQGKKWVIEGNALGGLRKLIPIIQKHDDLSEAKYYAALAYRRLGNYKKAEIMLKELLERGENFSEIYNELGLCSLNLGNVKKAIEYLKYAVKLKDDVGYLCNLGIAYFSAGDKKNALKYINKAYEINPQDEIAKRCIELIKSEQ